MCRLLRNVVLMLGLAGLFLTACFSAPVVGKIESDSKSIDPDGAESVRVGILMGAGKLEVQDGAVGLLDAALRYSHPSLAPDIRYRVRNNGVGYLEIEQDESHDFHVHDNYLNSWDLALNSDIHLDLDVTLGAGECDLNLSDLNLGSLFLQMGAGEATVNLDAYAGQDLEVSIQGGVGELTILLPSSSQIEASVSGWLGEINVRGLVFEDGFYRNESSGSGPNISIQVEAGIGQVNLFMQ